MAELFNVVFAGEVSGKTDPAVVRANLGKLFNASDAILDKLFSGQPIAVKKMVDRDTAMQLRAKMKMAGANTRLVQVDEQGRPLPEGDAAAPLAPPEPGPTMAVRVDRLAEEHARDEAAKPKNDGPPPPADVAKITTWALFPAGWILGVPVKTLAAPLMPNISKLVLAPVGADILAATEKPVVKPVQVDVSGITIAAVGADVLLPGEKPVVKPVQVDVSGITIAPPGSDLEQLKENKKIVSPDISHLAIVKG
jgi:hypothetical protein